MHIFRFAEDGGEMVLKEDTFEQLKPGLSAFPDAPQDAAASLKPLLDTALQIVPKAMQVRVSSLLPGEQLISRPSLANAACGLSG